jgi:hypothetical protein
VEQRLHKLHELQQQRLEERAWARDLEDMVANMAEEHEGTCGANVRSSAALDAMGTMLGNPQARPPLSNAARTCVEFEHRADVK